MTQALVEMTTDLVVAQIRIAPYSSNVINQLLRTTHATLLALSHAETKPWMEGQQDAQPSEALARLRRRPMATLQHERVICLECGNSYRLLSNRHLNLHGLTAQIYKRKWHIPLMQALSAKSLTQSRRRRARARDAGQYLAAWRAERGKQSD